MDPNGSHWIPICPNGSQCIPVSWTVFDSYTDQKPSYGHTTTWTMDIVDYTYQHFLQWLALGWHLVIPASCYDCMLRFESNLPTNSELVIYPLILETFLLLPQFLSFLAGCPGGPLSVILFWGLATMTEWDWFIQSTNTTKCQIVSSFCWPFGILDTRISSVRSSVRHACTTPPEIWNGLNWRALVELRSPNIA